MRIGRLFRFPIKGLPAEEITRADIAPGGGLTGDRAVAFSNGSLHVAPDRWESCSAFTALKNNTDLQKWQVSSQPPHITVKAPGAESLKFDASSTQGRAQATDYFCAQLPPQGPHPRHMIAAEHGMFDSRLSGISLINPQTVAALGESSQTDLDPLRYRGNILLEGLGAFEEFALLGKVLRIGPVRLLVTKSIERCSATSVNPSSHEVDLNGPQLLATHFGHLFCGLYATVLDPGPVQAGAEILVEDADPSTRPLVPAKRAPRFMKVVKRRIVDSDNVELTFTDPLGWITTHDEPGTHLRLHLASGLWRNYTITAVEDHHVSIAVRQQEPASGRLGQLALGDQVLVSGPHGTITATNVLQRRTVLMTAGIGITASLGLLRDPAEIQALDALHLVHIERHDAGELFTSLGASAARISVPLAITHFNTSLARPSFEELVHAARGYDNAMICGPEAFSDLAVAACREAGIGVENIHREAFVSPLTDIGSFLAKHSPVRIRCSASGSEFNWSADAGLLLDALEAQGLKPASSCRVGSCGNCALKMNAGAVDYAIDPSAQVAENHILTCLAAPLKDLDLAI